MRLPLENPWKDIGASASARMRAKRVSESGRHDFFWARNADGRYAFVLDTKEDAGEWGPAPEIRGISIGYYRAQHQLQLVLNESSDWEMFHVLCLNLIQATGECVTVRSVTDALMARLLRWQRLLSKGPRRILDDRAIRGLLGELLFLRHELMPKFGARAADFWQGPDRLPQDFVIGGHLFEVKTHLVGDAPKIYISSPAQLWSGGAPLFVVVIPLARCAPSAAGAVTLPWLIDALTGSLAGQAQLEVFEARLDDFGYVPFPEYEGHTYQPGTSTSFEVREGFPRIEPHGLADGVGDVRYSIRLDACEPFRSQPNWNQIKESA